MTDFAATPVRARFALIALILVAGVLTGAQLGKIAPLIPWYTGELGFSLVAAGWLAAVLGLFIAVCALPAGWMIDRLGLLKSLGLGVAALTIGGVWLAFAVRPVDIFAARTIEAVGYLSLCIGMPAVLDAVSPMRWKGPVLAIWSSFVPLGFAFSDLLAASVLPQFGPSVFLLIVTLLFAVLAVAVLALLRVHPVAAPVAESGNIRASISANVVLLAIGFGAFVVVSVSIFTFLPAFVAGAGRHYLLGAGTIALCVPLGNLLAGVLIGGRAPDFMARLGVAGFAIGIATAVPAFAWQDPLVATASALALTVSGALVASVLFAAIPFSTPRAGSVAVAFGLVSQAGGIATVFGPPLAAWIVETWGWTGLGYFLATVSAIGLLCTLPLTRPVAR